MKCGTRVHELPIISYNLCKALIRHIYLILKQLECGCKFVIYTVHWEYTIIDCFVNDFLDGLKEKQLFRAILPHTYVRNEPAT
jgi:hypothetical protein